MSEFYFSYPNPTDTSQDIIYELSSTTRISVSEQAVVTKYAVEDGSSIVDNFYIDNREASFSGVITDIQVFGQDASRKRSVDDWIAQIRQLRKDKVLVTVSIHSLQSIPNCVITKFNIDKGKEQGLTGWMCNLSFVEVDISERARLVEVKLPKEDLKDDVVKKDKNSDSSTKENPLSVSSLAKGAVSLGAIGDK